MDMKAEKIIMKKAQGLVEYILVLFLVAVLIYFILTLFGPQIENIFDALDSIPY